eukprot:COSAG02_NODE_39572_length_415_cov_1.246835_1_plen_52_part_10
MRSQFLRDHTRLFPRAFEFTIDLTEACARARAPARGTTSSARLYVHAPSWLR